MDEFDTSVEYRDVPSFPGYKAGSDGSVWSNRNWGVWKKLSLKPNSKGYCHVRFYIGEGKNITKKVHNVILETFVGPCPEGMEGCHHPDPDATNNALANLRWDTHANNMCDVFAVRKRNGIPNPRVNQGSQHGRSKLTEADIIDIREMRANGIGRREIGKKYGVDPKHITKITNREVWKHI